MATTLQQVKGYLDEKGFKYSIDDKCYKRDESN